MFEISDDRPAPVRYLDKSTGRTAKYPFRSLEVGQHFTASDVDAKRRRNIMQAAHVFGKRNGIKLTVESDGDSITVWRIQ